MSYFCTLQSLTIKIQRDNLTSQLSLYQTTMLSALFPLALSLCNVCVPVSKHERKATLPPRLPPCHFQWHPSHKCQWACTQSRHTTTHSDISGPQQTLPSVCVCVRERVCVCLQLSGCMLSSLHERKRAIHVAHM